MRKFFFVASVAVLALGAASSANATNWGLGYLYSDEPIGVFIGLNEKATVHVGVGFDNYDIKATSSTDDRTETRIGVVGSLLYDIWSGDSWGFGFAPGFAFQNFSKVGGDAKSDKLSVIKVDLKGHWDPTDYLSVWFGHGVAIEIMSPGDVGDTSFDSTTNFHTAGYNLTDIGFTVWIP